MLCSSVAVDVSHVRCGLSMRTVGSSKFSALWSHMKLPASEHAGYGLRQSYWLGVLDYRCSLMFVDHRERIRMIDGIDHHVR